MISKAQSCGYLSVIKIVKVSKLLQNLFKKNSKHALNKSLNHLFRILSHVLCSEWKITSYALNSNRGTTKVHFHVSNLFIPNLSPYFAVFYFGTIPWHRISEWSHFQKWLYFVQYIWDVCLISKYVSIKSRFLQVWSLPELETICVVMNNIIPDILLFIIKIYYLFLRELNLPVISYWQCYYRQL